MGRRAPSSAAISAATAWAAAAATARNSDDMMRAGRMLAQGDLRLVALAFIAEQPRHGYEIIKLVEEKTADWYSPSPGIIYPTLTYLEEAGYVTASTDGSKKQYAITDEGRAYLDANRDVVDAVLRTARRARRARQPLAPLPRRERGEDDRRRLSPLLEAAIDNLRDAAAKRLEGDEDAEPRWSKSSPARRPICGGRKRPAVAPSHSR